MKVIENCSRVLGIPVVYSAFRNFVCPPRLFRTYVEEYLKPVTGEKVLDVGCGPADILAHLPAVEYTGVDVSSEYISAAKARFGGRGRFLCGDAGALAVKDESGSFDLVMATGVLHHLTDSEVLKVMEMAAIALRPGGRFISYDGCFVPNQSKVARWLLTADRGKFVRVPSEYERLASTQFSRVESHLREDLLRIPYTHLIMRCMN